MPACKQEEAEFIATLRRYLDPEWREANGLTLDDIRDLVPFDLDDTLEWLTHTGALDEEYQRDAVANPKGLLAKTSDY